MLLVRGSRFEYQGLRRVGYSKTLGVEMSFTGRDQHVHSVNIGSSHCLLRPWQRNCSLPSTIGSQDVCPLPAHFQVTLCVHLKLPFLNTGAFI